MLLVLRNQHSGMVDFNCFLKQTNWLDKTFSLKFTNEPGHSIAYKMACISNEDTDQLALLNSLIRILARHS